MNQLPEIVATPGAEILAEVSETELRDLTEEEADEVAWRCNNWEEVKAKLESASDFAEAGFYDDAACLACDALKIMGEHCEDEE
jgi:hypothetical protein